KVKHLRDESVRLEHALEHARGELLKRTRDELLQRVERVNGVSLLSERVDLASDEIKQLADMIEEKLDAGVVILGSGAGGSVKLVCKVSRSLTDRYDAGRLIRELTQLVGGGGGGSAQFAEGGGKDPGRLDEALAQGADRVKHQASLD
ncbi:MAG: DHHA1 domain-containing protein, partial [Candidatus Bipolaricaulia bacterium]